MTGIRHGLTGLLLVLALLAGAAATAVRAQGYRLQPQDEILLRALRWDMDKAAYLQWEGVSGEYTLEPDGTLLVPLAGQVEAAGQTPAGLAEQLALILRRSIGMAEPPHISIGVTGHLPVYVLGDAAAPGAYPFRPGLTAQQALALAGGLLRLPLQDSAGNSLQPLRLQGEVRLLSGRIAALEEERRRLAADLQALAEPGSTPAPEAGAPPSGLEADILAAAQAARTAQGSRIRDLQQVLRQQISHLTAQIALRDEQIALTEEELETASSLRERGLTVSARVSSLTAALNDLEAKRLDLEIARLTARQQLNRAERDALELTGDARSQNLVRLNEVEQDIAGLSTRLATARLLHAEALAAGLPAGPDAGQGGGEAVVSYRIIRPGGAVPGAAGPQSLLQPGDTLEVSRSFRWPQPGQ